jgi:signal transduction histidine kinase
LLTDIERIDRLLQESLGYLRDNHPREASQRADLASVLQTVCDEFADMGHDVTYHGPARFVAEFKPLALMRAVTNLCENAVKFGSKAYVSLTEAAGEAVIDVADDGPGIPEQYRAGCEPFFKIDSARGGIGVGFGLREICAANSVFIRTVVAKVKDIRLACYLIPEWSIKSSSVNIL